MLNTNDNDTAWEERCAFSFAKLGCVQFDLQESHFALWVYEQVCNTFELSENIDFFFYHFQLEF